MSWAIGHDSHWGRDIGYGVPATCDQPDCTAGIDRGLAYVCGGEPRGGEHGCGLYFCDEHLLMGERQSCDRCIAGDLPHKPSPDTAEWLEWKLTDESWAQWRQENAAEVEKIRAAQKQGKQ